MSEAKREVWRCSYTSASGNETGLQWYEDEKQRDAYLEMMPTKGNPVAVRYVPESAQPAERAVEWVNIVGPNGTVAANEGETYLFAIDVSTNGGKPHWEYFTDAIVWDAETDPDWSSGEHGWDINDELWFRPLPPPPQPKEKP